MNRSCPEWWRNHPVLSSGPHGMTEMGDGYSFGMPPSSNLTTTTFEDLTVTVAAVTRTNLPYLLPWVCAQVTIRLDPEGWVWWLCKAPWGFHMRKRGGIQQGGPCESPRNFFSPCGHEREPWAMWEGVLEELFLHSLHERWWEWWRNRFLDLVWRFVGHKDIFWYQIELLYTHGCSFLRYLWINFYFYTSCPVNILIFQDHFLECQLVWWRRVLLEKG